MSIFRFLGTLIVPRVTAVAVPSAVPFAEGPAAPTPRRAGSSGTSGSGSGARCALRRTDGWSNTASMSGLCEGSAIISQRTIFCMSEEYTAGSAGNFPFITLNRSSSIERASNGTENVHISNSTQPNAQTSELNVYGRLRQTSGGM